VYRSGTTLIAQFLNNHPELRVTHETLHFFRFYLETGAPVHNRYRDIIDDARIRLDDRYGIQVPVDRIVAKLDERKPVGMRDLYDAMMVETFCEGRTDVRWGKKPLLQWANIPLFLELFPEGQVIHVIRDP